MEADDRAPHLPPPTEQNPPRSQTMHPKWLDRPLNRHRQMTQGIWLFRWNGSHPRLATGTLAGLSNSHRIVPAGNAIGVTTMCLDDRVLRKPPGLESKAV